MTLDARVPHARVPYARVPHARMLFLSASVYACRFRGMCKAYHGHVHTYLVTLSRGRSRGYFSNPTEVLSAVLRFRRDRSAMCID